MYSDPLAYFITFTTQGAWQHGDERESVAQSSQLILSNTSSEQHEQWTHRRKSLVVLPQLPWTVELVLCHCCKKRLWTLYEINVGSNHIHIVVTAAGWIPKALRTI